ncbi:MAG: sensor histidine kinase [Candidatus Kryptoniota bacterium]
MSSFLVSRRVRIYISALYAVVLYFVLLFLLHFISDQTLLPSDDVVRFATVFSIVSFLLFWGFEELLAVLSSSDIRFLNLIIDALERISGGDLAIELPEEGSPEFRKISRLTNQIVRNLKQDIVELKKLQRVRSEFLANVSHELRTPIFSIQGFIETLLDGAVDDKKVNRDFLEKAYRHAERLNNLLNDLIEISRIESGEMRMSFRYFDINEFLKSVVEDTKEEALKKNIALQYHNGKAETLVLGDKEKLRQVLLNLIDNAIKYTDSGGKVEVGFEEFPQFVRIFVSDTGVGIAEEHIPRIFERFYRVDKDRSRSVGGTGLGLAIVKHIVEAHRSKVDVESTPGSGSRFSFVLRK